MAQFQSKLQHALSHFIAAYPASLAVSLAYNRVRKTSLEQVHRDLDYLHRSIDRRLFGPRFHKAPPERRTEFVGFIEGKDENVHAHLRWRGPESRLDDFTEALEPIWRKLVPSGSYRIKLEPDPAGWAEYIVKEQFGSALDEAALFVSSRNAGSYLHS